jgi:hypothetical protein
VCVDRVRRIDQTVQLRVREFSACPTWNLVRPQIAATADVSGYVHAADQNIPPDFHVGELGNQVLESQLITNPNDPRC